MDEEGILKSLNKTEVCTRIREIRKVYEVLEEKQKQFCSRFNIHCKGGCGKCCEHFNPDITEVEAEFLAYGLIVEGIDEQVLKLLENLKEDSEYCPLYNFEDNEHHCSIYKWRPLVCRLFGATASKGKEGEPEFRKCKYNEEGISIPSNTLEQFKEDLIFMGDFGMMIDEIQVSNRNTEMLKDAVIKAIYKVRFMIDLVSQEEHK